MIDTNLIKSVIVKNGYTQEIVAKKMDISYQSLSNKILNKTEFTISEVDSICRLLNIKPEEKEKIFFAKKID